MDGWRTLAVLFMAVWHFLWDLSLFGVLPADTMEGTGMLLWRDAVAVSFILLSGISCRLSSNNLRRGVKTLVCALAVTAVTAAAGAPVWFGILHLLGCGMLLYAAVGKRLTALPENAAAGVCLVLFALTRWVMERVRISVPGLWILGLRTPAFFSADYYPLIPWLFLFLAGAVLGGRILASDGAWKKKKLPAAFTWPGRHALVIYLVHQPVLLGIAYLLSR